MKATEIDRAGALDAAIKSLQMELDTLKDKFRKQMNPGEVCEGSEFAVSLSEAPVTKGKVDYRDELIAAVGVKKVKALEEEAAKHTTDGTPRMSFRALVDLRSLASVK